MPIVKHGGGSPSSETNLLLTQVVAQLTRIRKALFDLLEKVEKEKTAGDA